MANEKDLKKLKAEDKKAVAGGVVYEFVKDGESHYYGVSKDGDEVNVFSDKNDAIKYSIEQGYTDNLVKLCKDENEAMLEASADCVCNIFDVVAKEGRK